VHDVHAVARPADLAAGAVADRGGDCVLEILRAGERPTRACDWYTKSG
jgi:hypothetical protein|tara:strand:- start:4606 stop:4749 length:144 start_codon:yes stop_codon:yes gene_type:complete